MLPASDIDRIFSDLKHLLYILESQVSLRVNDIKGQTVVVLAVHKIDRTVFHCFVEQSGRTMSLLYTTIANFVRFSHFFSYIFFVLFTERKTF